MNEYKFCFVICSNNDLLLEECVHYINHLAIPDQYSIELLTVKDAQSMTSGYNEAMTTSDAKYKIYMHQDVFILNPHFLSDLLDIFHSDPQIGLIGMVGYDTIPPDGVMWNQPGRLGNVYQCSAAVPPYPSLSDYRYSLLKDAYSFAVMVDGFLMATSRDYLWNTEDLKDFDFYDAYQSLTFLSHGHKIAVPVQRHPWCLHDDGQILNLMNYNQYRQRFRDTYKDILGKKYHEISLSHP